MTEFDEACSGVAALLGIDLKFAVSDQTTVHSIQLAVRRLLILTDDSCQVGPSAELARRQLLMLSRVLNHFGPSSLRPLRLLIAELIFRCISSPAPQTRKLSASLHKWFLALFGTECVQQRYEFLVIGLVRLACQHLGMDYQSDDRGLASEQQQNVEGNYESLYLANKSAVADSEARLAEQLTLVSPIDLFACYCDALMQLLSPVSADSNAFLVVDLYIPSILAVFDTLSEAIMKFRSNVQSSAVDFSRIGAIVLPLFNLLSVMTQSSFRRQLLPFARRVMKPVLLASSMVERSSKPLVFVSWARAYCSAIEAFGFRASPLDEHLTKSSLDLILKTLRNELSASGSDAAITTHHACSIISVCAGVVSAILSRSVSAQRNSVIDGVISSVLQVVVSSYSSNNDRHLCARCCKSVSNVLSAGILSPPSLGGVPSPHPTIASILTALSVNTRHADVEVASVFASTLTACLGATARPLAPPLISAVVSANVSQSAIQKSSQDTVNSDRLPLYTVPPSNQLSSIVEEQHHMSPNRRRLRSSSLTNNNDPLSSSTPNVTASKSASSAKRLKTGSKHEQDNNGDDDDVVFVPDPEVIVVESSPNEKRDASAKAPAVGAVQNNDAAIVEGLFSSFVAAPPDEPIILQ